jgi:REP element-mobilizing transposase RayT
MANTFSQIYMHLIFVVDGRLSMIQTDWESDLYAYISGIITNKNQKLITINGTQNHIHLLVSIRTDCCTSNLVRIIKSNSSKYVNEQKWSSGKFKWQDGYGVFSVSHSQIGKVVKYINNQKEHHKIKLFKDEFLDILKACEIEYKKEYLFDEI